MLQDSTLAFSREGTALAATHDGQVMNKGEMIVNGPVENTRRPFFCPCHQSSAM
jgi:hypothetical protein